MNSEELENYLRCVREGKRVDYEVCAKDELIDVSFSSYPKFVVVTTVERNSKVAGHWRGLLFEKQHMAYKVELFDSLGNDLSTYNMPFNFAISRQNRVKVQGDDSMLCANFVLIWASFRLRKCSTNQYLGIFSSDFNANDAIVATFLTRLKRCCFRYVVTSTNKVFCTSWNLQKCINGKSIANFFSFFIVTMSNLDFNPRGKNLKLLKRKTESAEKLIGEGGSKKSLKLNSTFSGSIISRELICISCLYFYMNSIFFNFTQKRIIEYGN